MFTNVKFRGYETPLSDRGDVAVLVTVSRGESGRPFCPLPIGIILYLRMILNRGVSAALLKERTEPFHVPNAL